MAAASTTWSNTWWRRAQLPDELTWFKWEAYATWLSGFALLVVVYYLERRAVPDRQDRARHERAAWRSLISLRQPAGRLARSMKSLCRSPLGKHEIALALVGYVFLVGADLRLHACFQRPRRVHPDRRADRHHHGGERLRRHHPQPEEDRRGLARRQGAGPAARATEGKQRSVHNNYLTLPVIFLMISNHYPLLFATRFNWLIVAIVLAIGPVIRHFYNSRHEGKGSPWWTWAVAAVGMMAIAWLSALGPRVADRRRAAAQRRNSPRSQEIVCSPLQHVPRGRAGLDRHRRGAEGRPARQRRHHPPPRAADRHQAVRSTPCRPATSPR